MKRFADRWISKSQPSDGSETRNGSAAFNPRWRRFGIFALLIVVLGSTLPILLSGCGMLPIMGYLFLDETGGLQRSLDTYQNRLGWNWMVGLNVGNKPVQIGIPGRQDFGVGAAPPNRPYPDLRAHQNSSSSPYAAAAALARQPDCSISGYAGTPAASGQGFTVTDTVPKAEDLLHTYAASYMGLASTADRFPNGCKDSSLGEPAQEAVYLGTDSHGNNLAAANGASGIYIFSVNPTTDVFTSTTITSIPTPLAIAAADLNGDGKPDLIVIGQGSSATTGGVYVLLNNGDGTFANPVPYAVGTYPNNVTIDDVNGDGKLDLLVAGANSGATASELYVLLGNGDGTLKAPIGVTGMSTFSKVATADFNGDGKKDVVLSDGQILLGNGDGTFQSPSFTLPLLSGAGQGATLVTGDFNNDGKQDVAVLYAADNLLSIFLGKGDGTFSSGASYATINDTFGQLSATDLDGDGNTDLFLGGSSGGYFSADNYGNGVFQMFMGYGNGTFTAPQAFLNTMQGAGGGLGETFFAVGDFNGDGKPDILGNTSGFVGGNPVGGLVVLAGNGKGNFTEGKISPESPLTQLTAADMNGDGKLDAVYVDQGGQAVGIAFGNGDTTFQTGTDYAVPNSLDVQALGVADMNGDGKPDVVIATASTQNTGQTGIYIYLNKGDGTLAAPVLIDTPANPVDMAIGDLNGDGKPDIVLTNGSLGVNPAPSQVLVYLNKGNGTFATPPASYSGGYSISGITIADMNKDGKPDLVFENADQNFANGYVNVMLGNGDGTFQPTTVSNPLLLGPSSGNIAVADFDGDGKPDVLIANCCGLQYGSIAFGNGDGTLQQDALLAGVSNPIAAQIADMNGDGKPDIVFGTGGNANAIAVSSNFGATGLAASSPGATNTALTVAPNPATLGQTITFTAQVTAATGGGPPTGTVTFMNGTTTLGTGTLNSSGEATYSTSSLPAGSYAVVANYGGDPAFNASSSSQVALTVTASGGSSGDFTLSAGSSSLTVTAGQNVTDTISVTPANGFNQATTFSCSGLPAKSSCSFSPASVTPSGTAASTTTMTITTTGATNNGRNRIPWPFTGGGMLAACGLLYVSFKKKKPVPKMLSILLLAMMCGFMLACGGSSKSSSSTSGSGGNGTPGTPAGTSMVTVTASSGSLTHSVPVSLVVQ